MDMMPFLKNLTLALLRGMPHAVHRASGLDMKMLLVLFFCQDSLVGSAEAACSVAGFQAG
jgi:hypothetical protein